MTPPSPGWRPKPMAEHISDPRPNSYAFPACLPRPLSHCARRRSSWHFVPAGGAASCWSDDRSTAIVSMRASALVLRVSWPFSRLFRPVYHTPLALQQERPRAGSSLAFGREPSPWLDFTAPRESSLGYLSHGIRPPKSFLPSSPSLSLHFPAHAAGPFVALRWRRNAGVEQHGRRLRQTVETGFRARASRGRESDAEACWCSVSTLCIWRSRLMRVISYHGRRSGAA